ncbi:MAG: molybdopterin-dependent oxidoreductase, partial [Phycisphaerae bacterium]
NGQYKFAFVAGGYPKAWITSEQATALSKIETLVLHDLFPTAADDHATMRLPSVSFAEREGSFMNCDDLLQPFDRAIRPREGCKIDGQFFYELAGHRGLYRAARVREMMSENIPQFADVFIPRPEPEFAH